MHVLLPLQQYTFRSGWPISMMWARASRDFTRQAKYIRQGVDANVMVPFPVAGKKRVAVLSQRAFKAGEELVMVSPLTICCV